jgi:hypothetical protein
LPPIQDLLKAYGIDLGPALAIHAAMGGDARIAELNRINTHFTALGIKDLEGLHEHARWQVRATSVLYWD